MADMVVHCAVVGCENSSRKSGILFFNFPEDQELLGEWLDNIRGYRAPSSGSQSPLVCSDHFEAADFEFLGFSSEKKLKPMAVPTVFDWTKRATKRIPPSSCESIPPRSQTSVGMTSSRSTGLARSATLEGRTMTRYIPCLCGATLKLEMKADTAMMLGKDFFPPADHPHSTTEDWASKTTLNNAAVQTDLTSLHLEEILKDVVLSEVEIKGPFSKLWSGQNLTSTKDTTPVTGPEKGLESDTSSDSEEPYYILTANNKDGSTSTSEVITSNKRGDDYVPTGTEDNTDEPTTNQTVDGSRVVGHEGSDNMIEGFTTTWKEDDSDVMTPNETTNDETTTNPTVDGSTNLSHQDSDNLIEGYTTTWDEDEDDTSIKTEAESLASTRTEDQMVKIMTEEAIVQTETIQGSSLNEVHIDVIVKPEPMEESTSPWNQDDSDEAGEAYYVTAPNIAGGSHSSVWPVGGLNEGCECDSTSESERSIHMPNTAAAQSELRRPNAGGGLTSTNRDSSKTNRKSGKKRRRSQDSTVSQVERAMLLKKQKMENPKTYLVYAGKKARKKAETVISPRGFPFPRPHGDGRKAMKCNLSGYEMEKKLQKKKRYSNDCKICINGFVYARELEKHLLKKHDNFCIICKKVFSQSESLKLHMLCHKDIEKSSLNGGSMVEKENCSECDGEFSSLLLLQNHSCHGNANTPLRLVSDNKCQIGGEVTVSAEAHERHLSKHTGIKKYSCTLCGLMFTSDHELKSHVNGHMNEVQTKVLSDKQLLKENSQLSLSSKLPEEKETVVNYQCNYCQNNFEGICSYEEHIESCVEISPDQKLQKELCEITVDGKNYVCGKCRWSSKRRLEVIYHLRNMHTGIKPHICGKCSLAFVKPELLFTHKCMKTYSCWQCEEKFTNVRFYDQHVEIHVEPTPEQIQIRDQCLMGASKENRQQCGLCGTKMLVDYILTSHIRSHTGVQPYKCTKCNVFYSGKPDTNTHKCNVNPQRYQCGVCNEMFDTETLFELHTDTHAEITTEQSDIKQQCLKSVEKLVCGYCGCQLNTLLSFVIHSRTHTGIEPHICHMCSCRFTSMTAFYNHTKKCKKNSKPLVHTFTQKKKKKKKKNTCDECGMSFKEKSDYESHVETHVDITPEQLKVKEQSMCVNTFGKGRCGYCGIRINQLFVLIRHTRKHTGIKPFICKLCNSTFRIRYELIIHSKTCSSDSVPKSVKFQGYECQICQKHIAIEEKFEEHMETHVRYTKEQEIILQKCKEGDGSTCGFCNRRYHKPVALGHFRKHTGIRPHHCQDCQIPFHSYVKYKFHHCVKVHISDYNEKCVKCSAIFTDVVSFEEHAESHVEMTPELLSIKAECTKIEEEGSYKCGYCEIVFTELLGLVLHIRSHTGIEPHECETCKKTFFRHKLLKKHHCRSKGVSEICLQCGVTCHSMYAYEEHIETHIKMTKKQKKIRKHCIRNNGFSSLQCGYGCKRSSDRHAFITHIRTHTGIRPYVCEQCENTFISSGTLKHHKCKTWQQIQLQYSLDSFKRKCQKCCVCFDSMGSYEAHVETHLKITKEQRRIKGVCSKGAQGNLPVCGFCEATLPCELSFVLHVRFHTGVKPHICTSCKTCFHSQGELNRHQRLKKLLKTSRRSTLVYQCSICSMKFPRCVLLEDHVESHVIFDPEQQVIREKCWSIDVKNKIKCGLCQKAFPYVGNLIHHVRTHTRIRPHICHVCNMAFVTHDCLLRHKYKIGLHGPVVSKRHLPAQQV